MLRMEPTPKGAGVTLYGDFWDLDALYDTIHALSGDDAPFTPHVQETVLALAYEVRHCYQGDREVREFEDLKGKTVTYYGVKLIWPLLLWQVSILRWSAAFMATTKSIQANLYMIEHCIEESLLELDQQTGEKCIRWMRRLDGVSTKFLPSYIDEVSHRYLFSGPQGKSRFKKLPWHLNSLSEISNDYREYEEHLTSVAKEQNCSPQGLHSVTDWPEIKW
ncbi:MAG: hypothetical protein CXR30_08785 [Geobacter sp.]|nr:MAG: hypothetical protein CXR30_08785 [Geobacter sp.]